MSSPVKISDRIRDLLVKRGVTDDASIEKFVAPDYERDIHDPFLLNDMKKAVTRIIDAIEKNEKIVIYADYDADGIPGAVIFHDFFTRIGYDNFSIYIPHRHDEGYGLHHDAIEQFVTDKVDLLITIDLGITAVDEVAFAQSHSMDVVVTDHHEAPEVIPDAQAVVNPKLGDYPDRMICGAAVAWKVVCAMLTTMRDSDELSKKYLTNISEGWEKWLLDMVGIATLSDMVPLINENRALAYFGLKVLRKSRRPGLRTLFQKLRMQQAYVTEDDIAFMVTPKINAASRMAHPMDAFQLLIADDAVTAQTAVAHLLELNEQRKKLVAQTMREVKKTLAKRSLDNVIVIGNPDWQAGILGLVANKISEEYNKPSFVWSREGDAIKGSCRSDGVCDLVALMKSVEDQLIQFGGHKEAGGFSAELDMIHTLEEHLNNAYAHVTSPDDYQRAVVTPDIETTIDEVAHRLYKELDILAPFGMGNPKPLIKLARTGIDSIRHFGKGQNHLEVSFRTATQRTVSAIAFFSTAETFGLDVEQPPMVDVYAYVEESRFRGTPEIRLRLEHIEE